MTRILAFGDLHLGAGSDHRLDALRDQEALLDWIVDLAVDRGIGLIANSGDTYDRPHPPLRAQHVWRRFVQRLEQRGIPMVSILGNGHDVASAFGETAVELFDSPLARVSRFPELIVVGDVTVATLPSVPLHRLDLRYDGQLDRAELHSLAVDHLLETARELRARVETRDCVLLLHWSISGAHLPAGLPVDALNEPVLPLHELEHMGFGAVIAGHIHAGGPISDQSVFYTGSPLCLNFGEAEVDHGVWILDTDEPQIADHMLEFIPSDDRRFVTVDVDLTEPGVFVTNEEECDGYDQRLELDESDVIAAGIVAQGNGLLRDAIVRVRYTATEEQHRRVDVPALRKLCLDAGASRVYQVEPTIVRASRARVAGFDRSLDEHEALIAWCEANEVATGRQDDLHALLSKSREASASAGTSSGGSFDPISLTARNVGRFAELDLVFQDGASVLLGQNGSGKSTALKCLELALYADDAGDLREILAPWADSLDLAFTFTLDGVEHRVRRSLRGVKRSATNVASGGKATLDFEVSHAVPHHTGDDWGPGYEPLTRETAKATQALIVSALGMSRDLFRASCFLAQGDGPAFLTAEPKERKAMAAELLDPAGLWAADAKYARALGSQSTEALMGFARQIEEREEKAEQLPAVAERLAHMEAAETVQRAALAEAEKTLEAAQADLSANQVASERVKTCRLAVETTRAAHTTAIDALAKAKKAEGEIIPTSELNKRLETVASRVPEFERNLDAARQANVARSTAVAEYEAAERVYTMSSATRDKAQLAVNESKTALHKVEERLQHLRDAEDGTERCSTCSQILGTDARASAIAATEAERETLMVLAFVTNQMALNEATRARDHALNARGAITIPVFVSTEETEAELATARKAAAALPAARHLLAELQRLADEIATLEIGVSEAVEDLRIAEQGLAEASAGVKDYASLDREVARTRQLATQARSALDGITAELVRTQQTLDQLRDLQTELDALRRRRDETQRDLDLYRLAERAFGRNGIPVLLLESVIDQIDTDANTILRRFPTDDGWTFSVRFETQREQATVERAKEELFVMVTAPDYDQDFRTLSGGETSRVSFAVRVALAMLLGRLRGADSRLLVLDELPFLDEAGEATLVELISGLVQDGTFSKVLTVSHSPSVKDSFEQTIEIEKHDGVSAIIAADREQVAA